MRSVLILVSSLLLAATARAEAPSPYAGQEQRTIKAFSAQQIDDLLAGRGMGLAKTAELNGYPGPAHVLDLAGPLELTPEQIEGTRALVTRVRTQASEAGRRLVEAEQGLERQFAERSVTRESLQAALAHIGALQAEIRGVHLEAHLDQTALMSEAQIARYAELRGYESGNGHRHDGAHPH